MLCTEDIKLLKSVYFDGIIQKLIFGPEYIYLLISLQILRIYACHSYLCRDVGNCKQLLQVLVTIIIIMIRVCMVISHM